MTKTEWLNEAKKHQTRLEFLISRYHPVKAIGTEYQMKRVQDRLHITASGAEMACEEVRKDIRKNFEGDPVAQFKEALTNGDVSKINRLLNDAWFGVPESTSCWNIQGFKEAVDLMEDLPESEN